MVYGYFGTKDTKEFYSEIYVYTKPTLLLD